MFAPLYQIMVLKGDEKEFHRTAKNLEKVMCNNLIVFVSGKSLLTEFADFQKDLSEQVPARVYRPEGVGAPLGLPSWRELHRRRNLRQKGQGVRRQDEETAATLLEPR